MAARSLTERIENLEQNVGDLQELPGRMAAVESHILQLRGEFHAGISAILARVQEGDEESQRHARALHEEVLTKLHDGDEETQRHARALHEEVLTKLHDGDEETRNQMRMLHEDVVARISLLGEGRRRKKR